MSWIFVFAWQDTSVALSIYSLVALSLDRYNVVVRPVESFVGGSKSKRIATLLVIIWVLSIGMALPAALFTYLMKIPSRKKVVDNNGTFMIQICYPFPEKFKPLYYPQIMVITRFVVQYVIPLVITGTLYTMMGIHLLRRFSPSTLCWEEKYDFSLSFFIPASAD